MPGRKRDTRFSVESSQNSASFENSLTQTLPTEMLDSILYARLSNLLWTKNSLSGRPRQRQRPRQPRLGGTKMVSQLGRTRCGSFMNGSRYSRCRPNHLNREGTASRRSWQSCSSRTLSIRYLWITIVLNPIARSLSISTTASGSGIPASCRSADSWSMAS